MVHRLLRHIREKYPHINIHGFSPPEFQHFAEVFGMPLREVIAKFKEAGLGSIPGGGGEILVDRVRQKISPLKIKSDEWLEVMQVAHELGLKSSATMMFGHVETIAETDRTFAAHSRSAGGAAAGLPLSSAGPFSRRTRC
jgi:cyclic dehypoxanthinyl futalosine synthase